jgi:hypothetical protein
MGMGCIGPDNSLRGDLLLASARMVSASKTVGGAIGRIRLIQASRRFALAPSPEQPLRRLTVAQEWLTVSGRLRFWSR